MKYCTKCGKELLDEAVVCINCGCAVKGNVQSIYNQTLHTPKAVGNEKKGTIFSVLNFVFDISVILSMVMLWISVAYSYGGFYMEEGCLLVAFILSALAFLFGITCFVFTLTNKHKGDKLFAGITRFIAGIGVFVAELLLLTTMI